MAGVDCAGAVQVCAMRVAELDPTGVPNPGTGHLYVSSALVQIESTPVYTEGAEMEQQNGCGDVCVTHKDCPKLKRYDLAMTICTPDPELVSMLAGGVLLTDGGLSRGWAAPQVGAGGCPNGVSVEAWAKAIVDGAIDATFPYWRFVWPRTKWTLGPTVLQNGIYAPTLTGTGEENPNWFDGPANDWIYDSDRAFAYARDTAIPTTACGFADLVGS